MIGGLTPGTVRAGGVCQARYNQDTKPISTRGCVSRGFVCY